LARLVFYLAQNSQNFKVFLFNFFEVALVVHLYNPHSPRSLALAAGNAGFREASSKQLNSFGVFFS